MAATLIDANQNSNLGLRHNFQGETGYIVGPDLGQIHAQVAQNPHALNRIIGELK